MKINKIFLPAHGIWKNYIILYKLYIDIYIISGYVIF